MPKDRRVHSLSSDRHRASPYPCTSKNANQYKSESSLGSSEDLKEWDEAKCSICMEHPHNAVLLKCSSHEKGCRPYICDTSYRHSNCLDQLCKSFASTPSIAPQQEGPLSSTASQQREGPSQHGQSRPHEKQIQSNLVCPLCRGQVHGWVVIEPSRKYMNSKPRSCACETCDFSGNYPELRKHARSEHPYIRPSKVDPNRQREWRRLVRERELEDALSTVQSVFGEEGNEGSFLEFYFWMAFSFLRAVFGTSRSTSPRAREQRHTRSSGRTEGGRHATENSPGARRSDYQSWESMPGFQHRRRQNRRR